MRNSNQAGMRKETLSLAAGAIHMLPQVRGDFADGRDCSFEELRHHTMLLADLKPLIASINTIGLLHPPVFAVWDERGLENYLELLDRVLHLGPPLEPKSFPANYPRKQPDRHLVLLAGHRRCLAYRQSARAARMVTGCPIYFSLSAEEALSIQLAENKNQRAPRGARELMVIAELYRVLTAESPMSFRVFADRIGASEKTVSGALRFMELPPIVRNIIFAQGDTHGRSLVSLRNIVQLHRFFVALSKRWAYCAEDKEAAKLLDKIGEAMTELAIKATQGESSFRNTIDQRINEINGQMALELNLAIEGVGPTERFISAKWLSALRDTESFLLFVARLIELGVLNPTGLFRAPEAQAATSHLADVWEAYGSLIVRALAKADRPSLDRLVANGDRFVELVHSKEGNGD